MVSKEHYLNTLLNNKHYADKTAYIAIINRGPRTQNSTKNKQTLMISLEVHDNTASAHVGGV